MELTIAPPVRELHSEGCFCLDCEEGVFSISIEKAGIVDWNAFISGKVDNQTDLSDEQLALRARQDLTRQETR